ncbi:MAG: hypothetical protein ACI915_003706 [Gammaproteobacteria bacterium]|jgi:hypothetical protein
MSIDSSLRWNNLITLNQRLLRAAGNLAPVLIRSPSECRLAFVPHDLDYSNNGRCEVKIVVNILFNLYKISSKSVNLG